MFVASLFWLLVGACFGYLALMTTELGYKVVFGFLAVFTAWGVVRAAIDHGRAEVLSDEVRRIDARR